MSCLFCDIVEGTAASVLPENRILATSESFVVKPGLGPIAPGYVLVCSRRHVASMSLLNDAELRELDVVVRVMSFRLVAMYGERIVRFEHGTCSDTHAGSCIDHAHLHLMPVPVAIGIDLALDEPHRRVRSFGGLQARIGNGGSYLAFADNADDYRVYEVSHSLPSQFVRRKVASALGDPDVWDWAVFPFRDRVTQFVNEYEAAAAAYGWTAPIDGSAADDPKRVAASGSTKGAAKSRGALAAVYPVSGSLELRARLGSVDFPT